LQALIGKPSEITYRHSEHVLQEQAQRIGLQQPLKHIYCVGDNVCTDIFGANLYDRYLREQSKRNRCVLALHRQQCLTLHLHLQRPR